MDEIVREHVKAYMNKNISLLPNEIISDASKLTHIEDIATSIMCTKWQVGYPGGSFAEAVVDNNLSQSFGRADETCRQGLYFFVCMVYNLDMPVEVYRKKVELESAQ
jgi:hypothetical protein